MSLKDAAPSAAPVSAPLGPVARSLLARVAVITAFSFSAAAYSLSTSPAQRVDSTRVFFCVLLLGSRKLEHNPKDWQHRSTAQ